MNPYRYILILFLSLTVTAAWSQNAGESQPNPTATATHYAKPNLIKSGFYLKIGPVFPIGSFATDKLIFDPLPFPGSSTLFPAARVGGNLGMGYLIYIGPAVANNVLRFGIDACFIDGWFASSKPNLPATTDKKESEFWYFFFGQKFGPLITINPVDRLMIDLSYKLNFNVSWHDSDWGSQITGQEVMMNIRYRIILMGFHYTIGRINYNDFDKDRPVHNIDINTFRVLLGVKF